MICGTLRSVCFVLLLHENLDDIFRKSVMVHVCIQADKLLVNYVLEMPVATLARDFMFYIFGFLMNTFLIVLVTFYLIFEHSSGFVCRFCFHLRKCRRNCASIPFLLLVLNRYHTSPLYAQVDEQIQKYIGLKSAISVVAAILVWVVFELLQVCIAPEINSSINRFVVFTIYSVGRCASRTSLHSLPSYSTSFPMLDPSLRPFCQFLSLRLTQIYLSVACCW
mgnify:CR=1 FL=1